MKTELNKTRYIGINIGSVSVNIVSTDEDQNREAIKLPHQGNPQKILQTIITEKFGGNGNYFDICGPFGSMSEIKAIESGLISLNNSYNAVLSLGGESFTLYILDEHDHVVNILTQDKCAAGSGEFFIQQIERLNLGLEDAISKAITGKMISIASRCSVHCKSDITHKLNKGEASLEDILHSLIANLVDKAIRLIIRSQADIQRLLVIGGLSLNNAFTSILKEKLSNVLVDIHEYSHLFEAYGTMLLVQENPEFKKPNLQITQTFSTLPSLKKYSNLVHILKAPKVKNKINPETSYILGIDVGSTTTKAILMDPNSHAILDSYYGRTNGNPIQATRNCLQEIIKKTGNSKIQLAGVTGSGRQVAGAYLDTPAIYNEISAHAKGAAFFDPELDTVFEIGGQDAKYMFLQNGVPVDYAMNASCSAGTGSFLEESAKCDLGISVEEIAEVALNSKQAVRFKADCAAFINSDIRSALQEGYQKSEIISGLVYSIANNYLNKVKGSRPIGKKIFFQGGVAKNSAVGYAFAQITQREIFIPPFPELTGAFGIALLAQEKLKLQEISLLPESTYIEDLIKSPLKKMGTFTCKACNNYCQINRYAVGDRTFPFGGKCTKYEQLRKKNSAVKEKDDYIEWRNDRIFSDYLIGEKSHPNNFDPTNLLSLSSIKNSIIGLPRALLTHTLYPLFSSFFKELGFKVILSDIEPNMHLLPNAAFCYPIQILHGAVSNLEKQGIDLVFLPYINKLNKPEGGGKWLGTTFCPIFQSNPYILAPIFSHLTLLTPELDFSGGYLSSRAMIDLGVDSFNLPLEICNQAYHNAVKHQIEIEIQIKKKGNEVLSQIIKSKETGVIIVGRSYNVFPKETSQSIPKKLASMGVSAIPFEFLEARSETDFPWYFANYVEEAIKLVQENDNLFLLYINNFSCTADAFIQNHVRSEMRSKPYLLLELDAHAADAGTQTRLEAFLEIIKNYRQTQSDLDTNQFQMARIIEDEGQRLVLSSSGEKVSLFDPRVKLSVPCFSPIHTDLLENLLRSFGFNVARTGDIKLDYAIEGLKYCSGKECVPLPIVLGHIFQLVKDRKPGEIIGYYVISGGDPCVVCRYQSCIEEILADNHIKDVFFFEFAKENDFLGVKPLEFLQKAPKLIVIADLILEIQSSLEVVGLPGSMALFKTLVNDFVQNIAGLRNLNQEIDNFIQNIQNIPIKGSPKDYPKVILSGDFFVRYSPFFLKELKSMFIHNQIIVKSTDLIELFMYGVPFGNMVAPQLREKYWKKIQKKLNGEFRIWKDFTPGFYLSKILHKYMERMDRNLRKKFEATGLIYSHPTSIFRNVKYAEKYINPLIFGEAIGTIGQGIEILEEDTYQSLILIGPQFCLPYKVSQSILKPLFFEKKVPFLVFEADISAMSPNMKKLITANIQQIKRRFIKRVDVLQKEKAYLQISENGALKGE